MIFFFWTFHSSSMFLIFWGVIALSKTCKNHELESGWEIKNKLESYIDCWKVLVFKIHVLDNGEFAKLAMNETRSGSMKKNFYLSWYWVFFWFASVFLSLSSKLKRRLSFFKMEILIMIFDLCFIISSSICKLLHCFWYNYSSSFDNFIT